MKIQGIYAPKGYIWTVTRESTGQVIFQGNTKQRALECIEWNGTIGYVLNKVYE